MQLSPALGRGLPAALSSWLAVQTWTLAAAAQPANPSPVGSDGSEPPTEAPRSAAESDSSTLSTTSGRPPPATAATPPVAAVPPPDAAQVSDQPAAHDEAVYSRRGFFLSLGFGCEVGSSLLCSAFEGASFVTKFQIGAGISDKLAVHWTSRVAWVLYQKPDESSGEPTFELHPWGVAGAGITYFLEASPRSAYVGADLGFSNISDFERGENHFGFGFCGAIGYEFGAHWSVEHALCFGSSKDEPSGDKPGTYRSAGHPFLATLTVNYLTL